MNQRQVTATTFLIGFVLIMVLRVTANPTGATILTNSTAGVPASTPDSRTDARGTITTIVLNSLQQNQNWKAYVGNVTGRLTLDDASDFTIYDWDLGGSVDGEVYVSRFLSPDFTNVSCADDSNVTAEQNYFNMTAIASDNINNTYNYTLHDAITIGGFGTIAANTCKSTATYMNDTRQNMNGSEQVAFQALILQDISDQLIFLTKIDDNQYGYDNNISINKSYDFQIIVPESAINSTPTTYYFWTELG